ncbi:MAG: helix-turn-helix domain-containing protein [Candidatus Cybelea sp.]
MENEGQTPRASGFGTLLRQHRLAAGLSQEALAERARMSTDGISALERGYRRTPQRETLTLLAGALALDDAQRRDFEVAAARSELLRRQGQASVTIGPWFSAENPALPFALTSFVGRETELSEIATLVGENRLVTVTGPGGVGKTQIALHIATTLSVTVQGPASFIGLAPARDPSLVVTAIATALRIQEVGNHPLLETVLAYLKNKTTLLVLDNCEHVIGEARTVAEALLRSCPRVRILATSRESLRCAGERVYRLPSLSVPSHREMQRISAPEAIAYGAIVLFVERARAVDHTFTLTDETAPSVAELCRGLEGIPLAIELAAARSNVLTVRALHARLNNRLRLLKGNEHTALPRQQTMRATIDWSYELLSDREQRMLEYLSVFAGGCTLPAAQAVSNNASEDDVLDLLSSLLDKSLLIADFEGREARYRLLESFREYALEKLALRGELEVTLNRHAFVCVELAEQLEHAFNSESDAVWRALARAEMSNWRAALNWALTESGDILLGQRLVGQLNVVWQYFARVEGRRWTALAVQLVDERTPPSVLACLTYTEASIAWLLREYDRQLTKSQTAIARYREIGDSLGVARAQDIAATALFALGRVAESQSLAQEVLAFARVAANSRLAASAMRSCSTVSAYEGNVDQARRFVADALRIYDSFGAKFDAAQTLNDLAYVEFRAGDTELALRHSTDALQSCCVDDQSATLDMRNDLTRHLIWLDRYDVAEERAREMLAIARERHEDVYAALALQHLGAIAALRPQKVAERAAEERSQALRVLGFSGARIAAMGSARWPDDQLEYDRATDALREASGADAVSKLIADGAAMTEDQALEETRAI